jgi:hypothetical protein
MSTTVSEEVGECGRMGKRNQVVVSAAQVLKERTLSAPRGCVLNVSYARSFARAIESVLSSMRMQSWNAKGQLTTVHNDPPCTHDPRGLESARWPLVSIRHRAARVARNDTSFHNSSDSISQFTCHQNLNAVESQNASCVDRKVTRNAVYWLYSRRNVEVHRRQMARIQCTDHEWKACLNGEMGPKSKFSW